MMTNIILRIKSLLTMTLPTFYLLYHEIKNKKREAKLKTQFIFKYIFTFYKLFLQKNKRLENSSLSLLLFNSADTHCVSTT